MEEERAAADCALPFDSFRHDCERVRTTANDGERSSVRAPR